jgi:hypothetical protein
MCLPYEYTHSVHKCFIVWTIGKSEIQGREVLKELTRSWQLLRKKREKKLNGGGGGALLAGPPQLPVYRSQWKFIFPIRHISFRKGLDLMLKLIWNYINPIGFAVLLSCGREGVCTEKLNRYLCSLYKNQINQDDLIV